MNQGIVIRGVRYTYDQLIHEEVVPKSDFEKNTIEFAKRWWSDAPSFTLKTSGSTGEPKTIEVTREQMVSSAINTIEHLRISPGGQALVCLDPAYIAGKMMLVRCFVGHLTAILSEPQGNPLNDISENQTIDFVAVVPYQLRQLMDYARERLNQIRVVIVGGAPIDKYLENEISTLTCDIYATYGMTETVSHVALRKLNGNKASDYFQALPGVSLSLDDRGCLVITANYLKGEIVTNDLVKLINQNQFQWQGRVDNVINSGGIKISPESVERKMSSALNEVGIAEAFFVGGVADQELGQKLCLFIESGSIGKDKLNLLATKAQAILPKYEFPKEVRLIEQFKRTTTGKVSRIECLHLSPVQIHKWIRRG